MQSTTHLFFYMTEPAVSFIIPVCISELYNSIKEDSLKKYCDPLLKVASAKIFYII